MLSTLLDPFPRYTLCKYITLYFFRQGRRGGGREVNQ
jgi:hypothetical protein